MIIVKIPKAQVHLGSKGEKTQLDSPLYSQPGPEVRNLDFNSSSAPALAMRLWAISQAE